MLTRAIERARFAGVIIAAITSTLLDHWRTPQPVHGYTGADNEWTDGT